MQKEMFITVGDNSLVTAVKCIHILGGSHVKRGSLGKFVVIVIPRRRKQRALVTKNIYLGLLGALRKGYKRPNGFHFSIAKTKVLVLNEQGKLLGTKIKGNIDLYLNKLSCFKSLTNFSMFI